MTVGGTTVAAPFTIRRVHLALLAALVLLAGLGVVYARTRPPAIVELPAVTVTPTERIVTVDGTSTSVLGQLRFHQAPHTSAPSPDRLDFRFTAPVDILGVLVSVDERGMEMTEVAVGIDAPGYGLEARDWLLHTSDTAGGAGIDAHIWFPVPFRVEPDERVSVVAWLFNLRDHPHWVSPEVIVYFRPRGA